MQQQSQFQTKKINILHFNDAYEIGSQESENPTATVGGVSRFKTICKNFKEQNPQNSLILFSGDLFSPSTMSLLYQGQQMLYPINSLNIDAACVGNHDFDYKIDHVIKLTSNCNFPWLCSNIFDASTGKNVADFLPYYTKELNGIKVGFIGLAEEEWLDTIVEIDIQTLRYQEFVNCAKEVCQVLKEELQCEFIIALTHMRIPNDNILAENVPEIDLILGGHDHCKYFKCTQNKCVIIKSGCDFKEYSIIEVYINNTQKGNYQLKNGHSLNMDFYKVTKDIPEDPDIHAYVEKYIQKTKEDMDKVIGYTKCPLDTQFSTVRTQESNFGNFYADVIRKDTQADIAILNAGTIRSDCIFEEGEITFQMMCKALPFADVIVVLEMNGFQIVQALENGVSKWPNYDGRFPQVSGMKYSFDPRKEPMQRIVDVWVGNEKIDFVKKYSVALKYFISLGKDGYDILRECKYIVDETNGQPHLKVTLII
ncbi:ser thr protein phosphatase family protein, putative [Ichthyophthirius multifiliis]|uniref:Ser thr protein phosphatase family protein, putative n=1 Tax=Ichthyophthirius multifiliis TaxID=5932 RepID=G0R1S3_ICHMU|nr:ser thr protein phosphatase family protein, putative [Ichthyophthirius multifiliis]EGR28575.1 ser thr protein phosphatase family protein, putative [Ichthyophthirius multifiliis]|eukprot:XP_004029811.1 ser thr protein phosphatase family protein, putative [Ichthyophthirius multifiliis]